MSNFNKFFFLSSFLFTLSAFNIQAMEDRIRLSSRDMQFFPENSLFLAIYEGDKELIETKLNESSQKKNINIVINGGALNGYTALRLSVNMWSGKVFCKKGSSQRKQLYKVITQILLYNGAEFTEDMKEDLVKMGITLQSQDLSSFYASHPLFSAVYKGDVDIIKQLLQTYGQKEKINFRVEEGRYKGYTPLMLAIALWGKKESTEEKENYKEMVQTLLNNGAEFTEDMEASLREMDVRLPERTGASYWRHTRRMGQEVDDLSKFS